MLNEPKQGPDSKYWMGGVIVAMSGLMLVSRGMQIGWFMIAVVVVRFIVFAATGK